MHKFLISMPLLVSLCSVTLAGPKEEALQALDKWTKAFTESDVSGIVMLYARDALFLGTGSKTLVTHTEDIRKYFEQAHLSNRPSGAAVLGPAGLSAHIVQKYEHYSRVIDEAKIKAE